MSAQKKKSEKVKSSPIGKVDKPKKETIKKPSDVNKKHIAEEIVFNKKIVDSIKEKLDQQEMEEIIIDILDNTIETSAELVEEAIKLVEESADILEESVDAVLITCNNQEEMNMDFNHDENETNKVYPENMLELMQGNLEKAQHFTINNTKELLNFYTKNLGLALNFNETLIESMNNQMESLLKLQNESLNKFKS